VNTQSSELIKQTVVWLIASLLLMATTWTVASTTDLNTRVKVIEDSRFSTLDARDLEIMLRVEMRDAIDEIKECLNYIQRGKECE
jgi:hypothetical protein